MKTINIIQLGMGTVGKKVLEQANTLNEKSTEFRLKFIGLANSQQYRFDPEGLSSNPIKSFEKNAIAHAGMAPFIELLDQHQLTEVTIIDTTASKASMPFLLECAQRKFTLVLANKKPLVEDLEIFEQLNATKLGARATVGAGLGVIPIVKKIKAAGDVLKRAEGCMSGSLGVLCSQLEAGEPFSKALNFVSMNGFTEPDPREDLSGEDMYRKLSIILRFAGNQGDFNQIIRSPMLPEDMSKYSVNEFMKRANHFDAYFKQLYDEAHKEGNTLKYVAEFGQNSIRIGLKSVDMESPIGNLSGAQKVMLLTTHKGEEYTIEGQGSGAITAAANVLEDVLELA